ncbi:TPA: TRAP transporter small permease [Mannheimia haemolytica]|uniref:TRAP transporter small permease protein n=4 Tax=Mannheimia haemolytica TaxID=75985 RepID=A0A547ECV7_MANHA|nr:TRAP transporter small permease [Mannheimia haemolytica]AWW70364.1 TRAP transporter small permease [Pasteurellaceae bacterium 12565]MDY2946337.1 TRAP transporter small permease [Mannheimia varigena]AGQ25958.1 C4-dicarboxylate ABC transporter permease [Mannheimia haemolytica D153]AGQ41343.1 C4-dicarboxylate ABC transporter permease [Mannheimia haemolytica D174]AGR76292.1 C4-dicarboxylate ABC transporter permease [Mannheimia haemolytica USMARC_2286]
MQISTALDRTLKLLAIIALSTMIILVFFNAVLRYFFDSGIAWSEEFARICFVYMIFLGIILVAKERGHLTVDIVVSALPAKVQMYLLFFADILVLVALSFITYGAYQLMLLTYTQKMPATEISSAFLYFAAVISSISYFAIVFTNLWKHIRLAFIKEEK